MRKLNSMALILLSLAGTSVSAEPFALVAADAEAVVVVDLADIQRTRTDTARFWEITRYSEPTFTLKGSPVKRLTQQYEVRCASKEMRRVYGFAYDPDGEMIDHSATKDGWTPSPPGSYRLTVHRIVCEGGTTGFVRFDDFDHLIRTHEQMIREGWDR